MERKVGAIWAIVSSPGQTSLPDQVARAKVELEKHGFTVPEEFIITTEWTSLDLFSCPEFLRLAGLVRRREIQGIGMLDRDRLHAEPTQRLAFLAELQGASVELVICQGPPILEGDWGNLIEHVHAIAKKQQVLRAKLGAKDGMADKVNLDRKPTSKHRVFGYKWATDCRLEPDCPNYDTMKLILDLALTGATDFNIQKELKKAGKLSPRGLPLWDRSSISFIIHNPIYAGRYYALKRLVAEPKKRKGDTYGNSSARNVPLNNAIYLPQVEIVNPPITWEQREQILQRRQVNQKLSSRNGKRDYLLRGFIRCYTHYGKKGEPRTYQGKPHYKTYIYTCPIGGCAHPNLDGPRIEETVKSRTWWLLNLQPEEFYRQIGDQSNVEQTKASLEKELRGLEAKYNRNINAETELESRDLLGQVHPEVYRRLKSSYQAERLWVEEQTQAIEYQLEQLSQQDKVIEAWHEIRKRLSDRLGGYRRDGKFDACLINTEWHLTNTEWRELFIALNLEVQVRDKDNSATWAKDWRMNQNGRLVDGDDQPVDQCIPEQGDIEIWFGIPQKIEADRVEQIGDIVFNRACPSPSS